MLRFRLLDGDVSHVIRDLRDVLMMNWTRIEFEPYKKGNGSWVLDVGNDFFLRELGDNQYELSYRYPAVEDRLEAVGVILQWRGPYKVIE